MAFAAGAETGNLRSDPCSMAHNFIHPVPYLLEPARFADTGLFQFNPTSEIMKVQIKTTLRQQDRLSLLYDTDLRAGRRQ